MREAMFIKRNVEKWNEYQHAPTKGPDETADRFVTLIDDLSYAKTFYPHSAVTRWINGIAANIYQSIYKNKKEKYTKFFIFWKYELPLLFRKYHKILLFCFLITMLFVSIGIWGSIGNEDFMRSVLSSEYVDKTNENIANGDPFGIYKSDNPFTMFVTIAINNIGIALLMVIGGLTLGVSTFSALWKNGIMLGAFHYMFFMHDLGMKSILVIWIHGTLEISSVIIASTAGFIISQSILFPGTFSRMHSFKKGVTDALKIMIVLVPVFLLAAFFESYITHLMSNTYGKEAGKGMPVWVSIIILLSSLSFVIWYFILHPIRLHKKGYYISPDGALKLSTPHNGVS